MVQSRDAAHRNGFLPRPAFVACGGAFSTRTPVPRTGRTRSEARFCFVAGNRDTACLTPRLTDRGIALAFACPISRSCATAARSACVTAIYPARKAGMASRARDSRCPMPVYPMPIRTAPTVNFVAPDATRQGRSLSSLLHFSRRLPPRAAVTPSQRILDPRRSVDVSGPTGARRRFAKRGCFRLRGRSQAEVTRPWRRLRAGPERGRRRRKSREGKDGQVD